MLSRTDYYLAGILEGEGCFSAHPTSHWAVHIEMVDEDIINAVAPALKFKGNIQHIKRANHKHSETHRINIYGKPAVEIMEHLYPLLGQRRKAKIDQLLNRPND